MGRPGDQLIQVNDWRFPRQFRGERRWPPCLTTQADFGTHMAGDNWLLYCPLTSTHVHAHTINVLIFIFNEKDDKWSENNGATEMLPPGLSLLDLGHHVAGFWHPVNSSQSCLMDSSSDTATTDDFCLPRGIISHPAGPPASWAPAMHWFLSFWARGKL